MNSRLLGEGWRMFRRNVAVSLKGFPAYRGDDREICRAIVERCFNAERRYFMTSTGNFREFFTRDFGLCIESLLELGYRKEVLKTLEYALSAFSRHELITTQITPRGIPVDSFAYAADSLPFLIRSLRIAGAKDLVFAYKPFLEKQVMKYREIVFDSPAGMVRRKRYFSSIRDHYWRDSSCYDNCCVAMLSDELESLGLKNPFRKHDFRRKIKEEFWNGKFFFEDCERQQRIVGDANVFPYYFRIFDDQKMVRSSIASIRYDGLDRPFPLRYARARERRKEIWIAKLAPDYEGSAVWLHIGLAYLQVVSRVDRRLLAAYLDEYKGMILRYRNFLEVFTSEGKPYRSLLYCCDDSLLWAANYLVLLQEAHARSQ